MKHEIFGIGFDHELTKADTLFDTVRDTDDDVIMVSKETYHHKEDNGSLDFKYKYVLHAHNLYEMTGEEEHHNKWALDLNLVPMPKSLLKKERRDVASSYDMKVGDLDVYAVYDYGLFVPLGEVVVDVSAGYDNVMPEKFNEGASVVETINSMRGFYLDRAFNRVGTTGWDLLNNWVGDGTHFITATRARRK